jgi:hypothetical protein
MRHVRRSSRFGNPTSQIVAVLLAVLVASVVAPSAFGENPLYCNGTFALNGGCQGPHGTIHENEARNESGGCVKIQMWASGFGFSEPAQACGGASIHEELTIRVESFPKCWNSSNASDDVHCRYSLWPS